MLDTFSGSLGYSFDSIVYTFTHLIYIIKDTFAEMGYLGIYIMMFIESSFFIPFPSELAMIPAGVLASEGRMDIFLAFFIGTAGAWSGATVNYMIGYVLGEPVIKGLVEKYGKYVCISKKHYEKAEYFFQTHGAITTFFGRLIPGIRQLVSLPPGMFRMNYGVFSLYTILGAGIWNILLLSVGYFFGSQQDTIIHYMKEILIGLCFIGIIAYVSWYIRKRKRKQCYLEALDECDAPNISDTPNASDTTVDLKK